MALTTWSLTSSCSGVLSNPDALHSGTESNQVDAARSSECASEAQIAQMKKDLETLIEERCRPPGLAERATQNAGKAQSVPHSPQLVSTDCEPCDALRAELRRLQRQAKTGRSTHATLQQDHEALASRCREADRQLVECDHKLALANKAVANARRKAKKLESESDADKSALAKSNAEIERLRQKIIEAVELAGRLSPRNANELQGRILQSLQL